VQYRVLDNNRKDAFDTHEFDGEQIVFRYCTEDGRVTKEANPNGSMQSIAGIVSEGGTVLGLMPHPERAAESALGGTDGTLIFHSLLGSLVEDGSFLKR
jgi:phosphoribosylformylglycinamidine synthase